MSIPGDWTLHWSWGCTGDYQSTAMTFNSDGTWVIGAFGLKGQWVEGSGEIIFNFAGLTTVYAGNVVSSAAVGISTTFGGSNGCWYLTKQGLAAAAGQKGAPSADPSGKAAKS